MPDKVGAGNGARTRDTKLGKLVLYQLSYARSKSLPISFLFIRYSPASVKQYFIFISFNHTALICSKILTLGRDQNKI